MIILLILITSSHDNIWISLGENCCWSLLGLKELSGSIVIVVTKWRVVTSGVAFFWRSKYSLQDCPTFYCIYLRKTPCLLGKLWLKAVNQVVIFVSEICHFWLSKIGKISKIIKNLKNISFAVE